MQTIRRRKTHDVGRTAIDRQFCCTLSCRNRCNSYPEFVEFPAEFIVECFDSAAAMIPQSRAVDVRRTLIICAAYMTQPPDITRHVPRSIKLTRPHRIMQSIECSVVCLSVCFVSDTSAYPFFTARCYASAVLASPVSVRLSVCTSQVGVLLKRLNVGSHKQHHTIAHGL